MIPKAIGSSTGQLKIDFITSGMTIIPNPSMPAKIV
jgi:hypothetical protein